MSFFADDVINVVLDDVDGDNADSYWITPRVWGHIFYISSPGPGERWTGIVGGGYHNDAGCVFQKCVLSVRPFFFYITCYFLFVCFPLTMMFLMYVVVVFATFQLADHNNRTPLFTVRFANPFPLHPSIRRSVCWGRGYVSSKYKTHSGFFSRRIFLERG